MNALTVMILVLVYVGGLDLFHQVLPGSRRVLWPLAALSIGFRKVWRAVREMTAPEKTVGS